MLIDTASSAKGSENACILKLNTVVRKISEKKFVPYRDSMLTMLLRDSLGGTAKTCALVTVSPEKEYWEETMSSCLVTNLWYR